MLYTDNTNYKCFDKKVKKYKVSGLKKCGFNNVQWLDFTTRGHFSITNNNIENPRRRQCSTNDDQCSSVTDENNHMGQN